MLATALGVAIARAARLPYKEGAARTYASGLGGRPVKRAPFLMRVESNAAPADPTAHGAGIAATAVASPSRLHLAVNLARS
jgi:hypothetical protein